MNRDPFTWQGVTFNWIAHRGAYGGLFEIAGRKHWFMVQGGSEYSTQALAAWAEWEGGYTRAQTISPREAALTMVARDLIEYSHDYQIQLENRFYDLPRSP